MDTALKDKVQGFSDASVAQSSGLSGADAREGAASEAATVQRAQGGDREAFRELVERYQERALRLAWTVLRDRSEAEDVTQEAFVKAYLSITEFENKSSFFTWLYRIVMNMAIDARRKKTRRGQHLSLETGAQGGDNNEERALSDVIPDEKPGPESTAIGVQSLGLLKRSFEGLSEEQRAVVVLREIDGLSYDEIADSLGVARGTVMSRLFYARKKMQADLDDGEQGL